MKELVKKVLPPVSIAALYFLIMILKNIGIINNYYIQIMMYVGVNIMMTASLNLVNGFTGQFCIGHAGFMSLGAYGAAIVTTMFFGGTNLSGMLQVPVFLLGLFVGGLVAAAIGFLIGLPTLKLKGDYLAIVTLAFGEIVRAFLRLVQPIGGARGMIGIPMWGTLGWIFVFTTITLYLCRNIIYSRFGRAFIAVRDNEIAADAMGINTTKYKIISFVFAAFIAGVAGGLYAHVVGFIQPDTFGFTKSSDYLVYLYAGGIDSFTGSIVGATILTAIPEALRFLANWRIVMYALALIMIMLYRPSGLCGGWELPFLKIKRTSLYTKSLWPPKTYEIENE